MTKAIDFFDISGESVARDAAILWRRWRAVRAAIAAGGANRSDAAAE